MSENYRSREERRQIKKKKQPAAKKQKAKGKISFFRKFLVSCLLLGIVGLVAGVATFFVTSKMLQNLRKQNLLIRYPQKFMIKMGN